MEEDIKQLEELILDRKSFVIGDKEHDEIYLKDISAIEKLIKGYRDGEDILIKTTKENLELKEYIRELEKENQSYRDYFGEPPCYDNASYILKSKVKEKIEELKNGIKNDMQNCNKVKDANWKLAIQRSMAQKIETKKVLQELMEDK